MWHDRHAHRMLDRQELAEWPAVPADDAPQEQRAEYERQVKLITDKYNKLRSEPGFGTITGSAHPWATDSERDWRLLAKFDSDDQLDWMWGDMGELYVMIRCDDLRAGRFDRLFLTWQCS